jgi:hypothetical protein
MIAWQNCIMNHNLCSIRCRFFGCAICPPIPGRGVHKHAAPPKEVTAGVHFSVLASSMLPPKKVMAIVGFSVLTTTLLTPSHPFCPHHNTPHAFTPILSSPQHSSCLHTLFGTHLHTYSSSVAPALHLLAHLGVRTLLCCRMRQRLPALLHTRTSARLKMR